MNVTRKECAPSNGFTLIEVIVVIAILSVVAGALAPLAVRSIDSSRQDLTLKRQKIIHQAIFGDPSASGSGFLSDIGRIPGSDLTELAVPGSFPLYAMQPCGVGMGWRGPYLLEGVDAAGRPLDGWGTPMVFSGGQIRSAGPDRTMGTAADNISYPMIPITANNVNTAIVLSVVALDSSASPPVYVPAGGQATVCFARDGMMRSMSMASSSGGYHFPPPGSLLPQGIVAVSVTGDPDGIAGPQPAIAAAVTIYGPGGGTVHKMVALR